MKKLVISTTVALTVLFSTVGVSMPASASAQEIYATNGHKFVNTAKSYIGKVTYRFGTRDPQHLTFDCSAFTQFVFQKNGVSIPWGSKAQTSFGSRVPSKSKLAIGDLVMFSVSKPGQIDHVGIYVGNGNFISNTKSSGVVISSLNTGYWSTRYITARHY
ncbi:C40 family peptidase [Paenibacillus aceris]|uniref:Cell wall-associated NlpC family hydrolase n=1 Tax=Paenibacillus aceris TaxID=869555 RepID=A0ABS4I2L0_9BACL|nr:C40 family peptidase [Paenibacillus aceris]MBP1964404.1 cell wall-associated NlpC family hydrolase [Paenibacillus aceris]NHW35881.1 C40 family peptidase [Paenibacillus aceris]